jgi:hypothetical protein
MKRMEQEKQTVPPLISFLVLGPDQDLLIRPTQRKHYDKVVRSALVTKIDRATTDHGRRVAGTMAVSITSCKEARNFYSSLPSHPDNDMNKALYELGHRLMEIWEIVEPILPTKPLV